MTQQLEQAIQEADQAQQPVPSPFAWAHSTKDAASLLEAGPWTAVVADPVPTPPAIRLAGRYISRGLLRHASGRSLSRDFPGSTPEEALLLAKRWATGSIQMWLKALEGTVGTGDLSLLPRLPEGHGVALTRAVFDSLKVSKAKGHLPETAPTGVDAMQPRAPAPARQPRKKGRRRKRRAHP